MIFKRFWVPCGRAPLRTYGLTYISRCFNVACVEGLEEVAVDMAARASGPSDVAGVVAGVREALLAPAPPRRATALFATRTFAWRTLLKIKHSPDELSSALIMP